MSVDSKYRPHLEAQLEGGEELRGVCVASQQKGMLMLMRGEGKVLGGLGGGEAQRQGIEALAGWFQANP